MREKIKATLINGKGSAKHNDRTYEGATEKEKEEVLFKWKRESTAETFEENEMAIYEKLYGRWLQDKNEKYLKRRQKDRVRTMKDIVGRPNLSKKKGQFEPCETIIQIGTAKQNISYDTLKACGIDYINAIQEKWGHNMCVLDFAIHKEEAYHIHMRRTWAVPYYDENGKQVGYRPAKKEALRQLGFHVENGDRYNNETVLQTAEERELWYDILQEHGIVVDREPDPDTRKHADTRKAKQEVEYWKQKADEAHQQTIETDREERKKQEKLAEKTHEIEKRYRQAEEKYGQMIQKNTDKLRNLRLELSEVSEKLQRDKERSEQNDRDFYGTKGENNLEQWINNHR